MSDALTSSEEPMPKRRCHGNNINISNSSSPASDLDSDDNDQINSSFPLNYDCLLKVFRYCDIEMLSNLANVCKVFRTVAEDAFRRQHNIIKIFGLSRSIFRRILCKFGHLIISLDTDRRINMFEISTDALVKYCPKLENLYLYSVTINCNTSKPLFTPLKRLRITYCNFIGSAENLLDNCSILEELHVTGEHVNNFLYTFPKLERFTFRFHNNILLCSTFSDFLKLNRDLKCLHCNISPNDEFVSAIVSYTPNLEVLELNGYVRMRRTHKTQAGLSKLAKLKKLQQLTLLGGYNDGLLATPLIEELLNANVPIESLTFHNFVIGPVTNIIKLESLHTLNLNDLRNSNFNENELIPLLAQFPLLKKLKISIPALMGSVAVIDAIVNSNTFIEELEFGFGIKINSTTIQSISNLKSLRVFRLQTSVSGRILQRDLICLSTKLPLLTEIDVTSTYKHSVSLTVDGLKQMLQNGKELKRIKLVGVRDLHINQSAIETLFDAIQVNAGVSIYFEGCQHKTSFDVPGYNTKSNSHKFKSADNRFEIIYEKKMNRNICELCDDEVLEKL